LLNLGYVVNGGRTLLAELPSDLTPEKQTTAPATKKVPLEALSAPIEAPVADAEPTIIENAANQEELPLVIDHPKATAPKKPVKKAAPAKAAAKPAATKTPKPKGK
jgi:phosphatidylserine decarboxylase